MCLYYFYVVSWLVICVYLYPSTYVGEHVYRLSFCVTLSFDKIDNNNNKITIEGVRLRHT